MLALLCVIVGAFLLGKAFAKKNNQEKGIVVILGGTLLLIYFFPGIALLILGLVLLSFFGVSFGF
ncbi:MAG: hypothetical protein M0R80_02615 [Proteobacteria bacterium]|jgi:hypothetical protein|nr:hypothetical protein [Pseudomonadota bacterium]